MSLAISVPPTRTASAWNVLVESLLAEKEFFRHQVLIALRHEHVADRSFRLGALAGTMASNVVDILSGALKGHEKPTGDSLARVQAAAEEWAHHGVSVEDMLGAWHRGVEAAVAYVRETGTQLGVGDSELLPFVQSAHAWAHTAMVSAVTGYSRVRTQDLDLDDKRRESFVRGVLFGTLPVPDLRSGVEMYGLDPAAEYVAVRARIGERHEQRSLEEALGFIEGRGLCAIIDGALVGFVTQAPPANTRGTVGVGPRRSLRYLAESYRLASRALTTMQACGLHGAREFSALSLQAAVVGDGDVGDALRHRYFDALPAGESARELIGTLRAYLACDMHVERTASRLFVHQNTVRYRLARFEELTGVSLRSTQVIVELWWALTLSDLGT